MKGLGQVQWGTCGGAGTRAAGWGACSRRRYCSSCRPAGPRRGSGGSGAPRGPQPELGCQAARAGALLTVGTVEVLRWLSTPAAAGVRPSVSRSELSPCCKAFGNRQETLFRQVGVAGRRGGGLATAAILRRAFFFLGIEAGLCLPACQLRVWLCK